jgi:hypothetical protein
MIQFAKVAHEGTKHEPELGLLSYHL